MCLFTRNVSIDTEQSQLFYYICSQKTFFLLIFFQSMVYILLKSSEVALERVTTTLHVTGRELVCCLVSLIRTLHKFVSLYCSFHLNIYEEPEQQVFAFCLISLVEAFKR